VAKAIIVPLGILICYQKQIARSSVNFSSVKCFKCTLKKIDFSPYLKYSCDYCLFWYMYLSLAVIYCTVVISCTFYFVLLVLYKWRHIRPLVVLSIYGMHIL